MVMPTKGLFLCLENIINDTLNWLNLIMIDVIVMNPSIVEYNRIKKFTCTL